MGNLAADRLSCQTGCDPRQPRRRGGTMSVPRDADSWLSGWVRSPDCALRGDNRRGGSLTAAPNTMAVAHDIWTRITHLALNVRDWGVRQQLIVRAICGCEGTPRVEYALRFKGSYYVGSSSRRGKACFFATAREACSRTRELSGTLGRVETKGKLVAPA